MNVPRLVSGTLIQALWSPFPSNNAASILLPILYFFSPVVFYFHFSSPLFVASFCFLFTICEILGHKKKHRLRRCKENYKEYSESVSLQVESFNNCMIHACIGMDNFAKWLSYNNFKSFADDKPNSQKSNKAGTLSVVMFHSSIVRLITVRYCFILLMEKY